MRLCVSCLAVWQQMAAFDTGEPFVFTAVAVCDLFILIQIGSHFTFISDSQTVFPWAPLSFRSVLGLAFVDILRRADKPCPSQHLPVPSLPSSE